MKQVENVTGWPGILAAQIIYAQEGETITVFSDAAKALGERAAKRQGKTLVFVVAQQPPAQEGSAE